MPGHQLRAADHVVPVQWFKMPRETFDAIHYSGMAFFKIMVFVFNAVPYIALLIVG